MREPPAPDHLAVHAHLQIAMHKNNAQAIFVDNGVELKKLAKRRLFAVGSGLELLKEMNVSAASHVCLELTLQVLWKVVEAKERLAGEILMAGEAPRSQVELLISIKGVTPLIALAFLADVADIRRFRTLRKMNAYLGLVPRSSNSGGKDRPGHITRESRKLTRTILTQCVHHVASSSESLEHYYRELREKRGTGRARIAVRLTRLPLASASSARRAGPAGSSATPIRPQRW